MSQTRATQKLQNAIIVNKLNNESSAAMTYGAACKYDTADGSGLSLKLCAAGDKPDFICLESSLAAASKGQFAALTGGAVVPVLVGQNGCTVGDWLVVGGSPVGMQTQATADGATVRHIAGKADQTGVSGDIVGMVIAPFTTFTS